MCGKGCKYKRKIIRRFGRKQKIKQNKIANANVNIYVFVSVHVNVNVYINTSINVMQILHRQKRMPTN